jgi:hypothetical protein
LFPVEGIAMIEPRKLPNLILGGPGRTGTTSMFEYLLQHPEICGARKKETNYFLSPLFGEPLAPVETYAALFRGCEEGAYRYVVESTPAYFIGGRRVAKSMKSVLGNFRIIFTLRDPVERFLSGYWHIKSKVQPDESMSYGEFLERSRNFDLKYLTRHSDLHYGFLKEGCYIDHLEQWYDPVGPESIHIIFYENLVSDRDKTLGDLWDWLGLVSDDDKVFPYTNKSISIRSVALQKMANLTVSAGESFFRRNQGIKNILKNVYYRLNARNLKDECPLDILQYLKGYYKLPNKRLYESLREKGVSEFPSWLA